MPVADEMPGPLPHVPCCLAPEDKADMGCPCGATERVLRAGAALTPEQREWCIKEIAAVEGHTREECDGLNDAELGSATLAAWTDYCRDKGLL